MTYWNAQTSFSGVDRSQAIYVSDMTFTSSDYC